MHGRFIIQSNYKYHNAVNDHSQCRNIKAKVNKTCKNEMGKVTYGTDYPFAFSFFKKRTHKSMQDSDAKKICQQINQVIHISQHDVYLHFPE